jgi:hypothetical protein
MRIDQRCQRRAMLASLDEPLDLRIHTFPLGRERPKCDLAFDASRAISIRGLEDSQTRARPHANGQLPCRASAVC